MKTKSELQQFVRERLGNFRFIAVSNRQPVTHKFKHGKIESYRTPGGVVTALDPVMQACQGTWIAFGNGDADKVVSNEFGKIGLPLGQPSYTLKRVWLTKEEEMGYYNGYSNEALWPLCHMAFQRPIFREEDWNQYVAVNKKFAESILEEIDGKKAFVWLQDYHLCLVPKFLKEMAKEQVIIAHFWHIPWPSYEAFRICSHKKEILEGLLANDILGFQIMYHCNNFIDVVDRELESKINRERHSIIRQGHETLVRAFPISIDFQGIEEQVLSDDMKELETSLKDEYGLNNRKVILGIERMDYTKGIPEKFLAYDQLLTKYPQIRKKVVFVFKGAMSRIHLDKYKMLNAEIAKLIEDINWRHGEGDWKPIIVIEREVSYREILALYRIAGVCVVSSLHDGMNLVAKEFVACRDDEGGVLMLSQFTGAAREMRDAVLINPYAREQFCDHLYAAITMPDNEVKRRMAGLRAVVKENNIYGWAEKIMTELFKIEIQV